MGEDERHTSFSTPWTKPALPFSRISHSAASPCVPFLAPFLPVAPCARFLWWLPKSNLAGSSFNLEWEPEQLLSECSSLGLALSLGETSSFPRAQMFPSPLICIFSDPVVGMLDVDDGAEVVLGASSSCFDALTTIFERVSRLDVWVFLSFDFSLVEALAELALPLVFERVVRGLYVMVAPVGTVAVLLCGNPLSVDSRLSTKEKWSLDVLLLAATVVWSAPNCGDPGAPSRPALMALFGLQCPLWPASSDGLGKDLVWEWLVVPRPSSSSVSVMVSTTDCRTAAVESGLVEEEAE